MLSVPFSCIAMARPTAIQRAGWSLGMPMGSSGPIPVSRLTLAIYASVLFSIGGAHLLIFLALNKTVFCILYHVASVNPSPYHLYTLMTVIALALLLTNLLGVIDGKEVKRLTSTDSGNIEDPESGNTSPTPSGDVPGEGD